MSEQGMIDLQSTLMGDLYRSESKPPTADVKQVIDTLKERVQPLTAEQMKVIGYLEYLQSRPLHGKEKPYDGIIKQLREESYKVAPPGFFIRVIEALIPRPMYVDGKSFAKMSAEKEGKK